MKIRLPKKLFGKKVFESLEKAIEFLKDELKQEPLFPTEKHAFNKKLLKRLELLMSVRQEKIERGERAIKEVSEKIRVLKKEFEMLAGLPNYKQIGRMLDLDISFINTCLLDLGHVSFNKHRAALREIRCFFKQGSSSIKELIVAIDKFLTK